MWMHVAERMVVSFWVGSLWAVGYLAVPGLFHHLTDDKVLAGKIAGEMFIVESYTGFICAGILFLIYLTDPVRRFFSLVVVVAMVALVAYGHFELQPQMAVLKSQGLVEGSAVMEQFKQLHGISAVAYLLTSILGLGLLGLGVWSTMRDGVRAAERKAQKAAAKQAKRMTREDGAGSGGASDGTPLEGGLPQAGA